MLVVSTTPTQAAGLGFKKDDIIQEWLWDEDVDESVRDAISSITGQDLVDEDYDGAVDGALIWWRDGDDEDALTDDVVDAEAPLDPDSPFWIIAPKPGRVGAASPSVIQNAAKNAGMNPAKPMSLSADWNAIRLLPFGAGRQRHSAEH
ncbi:MAG: DUF3052 domain-containing protein [Aeriscardovia sp.]|nr:DUF3052 domain-containing protein [Aeriscardovia sp.]